MPDGTGGTGAWPAGPGRQPGRPRALLRRAVARSWPTLWAATLLAAMALPVLGLALAWHVPQPPLGALVFALACRLLLLWDGPQRRPGEGAAQADGGHRTRGGDEGCDVAPAQATMSDSSPGTAL